MSIFSKNKKEKQKTPMSSTDKKRQSVEKMKDAGYDFNSKKSASEQTDDVINRHIANLNKAK